MGRSTAIPDRSDRRPRPARTKSAAIVMATAAKAGPADIMQLAVPPVITRGGIDIPGAPILARQTPRPIFLGVGRLAVAQRLLIARQKAVAMPNRRRLLMDWRRLRDDRQQRHNDSNG